MCHFMFCVGRVPFQNCRKLPNFDPLKPPGMSHLCSHARHTVPSYSLLIYKVALNLNRQKQGNIPKSMAQTNQINVSDQVNVWAMWAWLALAHWYNCALVNKQLRSYGVRFAKYVNSCRAKVLILGSFTVKSVLFNFCRPKSDICRIKDQLLSPGPSRGGRGWGVGGKGAHKSFIP